MYFSKDSLIALYKKLSSLYPKDDIEQQGGTQFASELKYFLATDYFKKQKGKPCDTNIKDDKDFFVYSVGKIVLLSESGNFLATKNFANSVGETKDFDVGSNFFSANAVAKSKISLEPQKFPNRHPQLLAITKGVVDTYSSGYDNLANDKEYLGGIAKKYALLFLWLNRFTNFSSNDSVYNDCLFNLKKEFSLELVSALQWNSIEVKNEVFKLLADAQLAENKPNFEKTDFVENVMKNILALEIPIVTNGSLTEADLANVLASEKENNGTYAIHLFGIKYAKLIQDKKLDKKEIVNLSGIGENYFYELSKGIGIYNLAKELGLLKLSDLHTFESPTLSDNLVFVSSYLKPAEPYEQIIFYGVPGSGKSFKIDNEKTAGAADVQKQKVVFHPDYTNADFIGQIIPKMKETVDENGNKKSVIEYSFKPGPFTTILRRALRDKEHQYYLLIEEINRGNAAAIFGDLFQLLDRGDDGWSCSPVNNDDINFYVASEYEFWDENYSDSHTYDAACVNHPDSAEAFGRNSGLRLPPNLSIYATMNTNDQNVFTLDNAFNRRFKSEYISNKENPAIKEHRDQFNLMIGETGIRWGAFRNVVNERIVASGLSNAEDKQLGLFFVKREKEADSIKAKDFADKVLKYLWHDVFKRDRDIFKGDKIKKFEDLIDYFTGVNAFKDCFADDFVSDLEKNGNNNELKEPGTEN